MVRDAFAAAGGTEVALFQSNGTVVFRGVDPQRMLDDALGMLAALGFDREGFVLSLPAFADIAAAHAGAPDVSRREVTLHGGGVIDTADEAAVREAARRRCRMLDAGGGWVVTVDDRERESNATPTVERLTGGRATSRSMATVQRLLDRHLDGG